MADQAKIQLIKTIGGDQVAPRTSLKAVTAEGKKGQVVGFIEDNSIGVIDVAIPDNALTKDEADKLYLSLTVEEYQRLESLLDG